MNDRLLDLLIEFDEMGFAPATVCDDPEAYAKKWKDQVWEAVRALKAENAALRERLEKSVELPRVECIMTREWLSRELIGSIMFEWCALYKKGGYLMAEPCLSKEAAEIRLAELKGEQHG